VGIILSGLFVSVISAEAIYNETESINAGEFRTYVFDMSSEIKYTFRFTVIQGGLVDVIFTDQAGFINYNTFENYNFSLHPVFLTILGSDSTNFIWVEFEGFDSNNENIYIIVDNTDKNLGGASPSGSVTYRFILDAEAPPVDLVFQIFLVLIFGGIALIFLFFGYKRYARRKDSNIVKNTYALFKTTRTTDDTALSKADLDLLWHCPNDQVRLQVYHEQSSRNPNFIISKENIAQGLHNAVSLRKIPQEATAYNQDMLDYLFTNSALDAIELISVKCPQCKQRYAAPRTDILLPKTFTDNNISRTCPHCGAEILDSDNLCMNCGKSIT